MKKYRQLGAIHFFFLFLLGLCFVPTASAVATYEGITTIEITLESVTDADGSLVTGYYWSIIYSIADYGISDVYADGIANAGAGKGYNRITGRYYADFGGSAINGYAETTNYYYGKIDVENSSDKNLTFMFNYDVSIEASVSGSHANGDSAYAFADARIQSGLDIVFDQSISADLNIGPLSDSMMMSGSFDFELRKYRSHVIYPYLGVYGNAAAVIPLPSTVWLFGSGLLGLIGITRRKKVA